jgi:hypothetical protein
MFFHCSSLIWLMQIRLVRGRGSIGSNAANDEYLYK